MKRYAAAIAVVSLATVLAASAVASPKSLYTKLLTTKFSPVPSGYYSAKVGTQSLDSRDKNRHAIGAVFVSLDTDAGIDYTVFPSWRNARDRMTDKPKTQKGEKAHVVGKVPGFHVQSKWINGSITGKNAFGTTVTNGLTLMCARSGNVIVCADTLSTDSDESGDVPGTISLLRAGMRHLTAVRKLA